jgi:hypothetical protein
MREIIILQDALVIARNMVREASKVQQDDTLTTRIARIIMAQRDANTLLMRARAQSNVAAQASSVVASSFLRTSK